MRDEDNAVPANAFAVPPTPLSTSQGPDIPFKGIGFEFVNRASDALLYSAGQTLELPFGCMSEFNGPLHVLLAATAWIVLGAVGARLLVRSLLLPG